MRLLLCLTLSLLFQGGHSLDFECAFLPPGMTPEQANHEHAFKLTTNATEFERGSNTPIKVTLSSTEIQLEDRQLFNSFIIQGLGLDNKAHGRWQVLADSLHTTKQCNEGEADTLVNQPGMDATTQVEALWYPPEEHLTNGELDFNAAVMHGDGSTALWTGIRSVVLTAKEPYNVHDDPSETEAPVDPNMDEDEAPPREEVDQGTGEDPNDEEERAEEEREEGESLDHGLQEEIEAAIRNEEHKLQLIKEEDDESEGDWVREEEEERRREEEEQDEEMREYEIRMSEEERKRQEMIEFEIRDKEEHERNKEEEEDKETPKKPEIKPEEEDKNRVDVDKPGVKEDLISDSGVGQAVLSGLLLICSLLMIFL